MNRVLFVGQGGASPAVQEAVRRCPGRWHLGVASSGGQALAALRETAYDVVIAEVSPNHEEGLDVLDRAKLEHPETARIVLSEPMERNALARALGVAHQCIPKPCEADALWKVIERTTCLHGLMRNTVVRSLLGGLDRLPSVPRSYVALTRAVERENVALSEIVAIVETDSAMASKVLQLVNSAYFGRPRRISSIPVTVSLLGLERLRALALSTHVFGMIGEDESRAYGLDRLQERSLMTAQLARRFLSGGGRAEEGFTVGLLQDIGKLLLAVSLEDRYREVHEEAARRQIPIESVEREAFGVSHAVIGACLLSMWGLPVTIVEAVAFHHAPSGVLHDDTALVDAVHVADALAQVLTEGRTAPGTCELALDPILMSRDGMEEKIQAWRLLASQDYSLSSP